MPIAQLWLIFQQADQPLGARYGQGPQKDRLHDAEDRRGAADAERQCEDRRGGVAGLIAEAAEGVAEILEHAAT